MLIIDLSNILHSSLHVFVRDEQFNTGAEDVSIDENILRHLALKMIHTIRLKFRNEKNIVIACDSKNSWRYDIFPYYKAARKELQKESKIDWNVVFEFHAKFKAELKENFPYKVLEVSKAEADDIIGTLVENFYRDENIVIVSEDKDFIQLHKYHGVSQYAPIRKIEIVNPHPSLYLKEHIIRGDKGDGIPNFQMSDSCLVEKIRQKQIRQTKLDVWITQTPEEICEGDENLLRGYCRNEALIDLSKCPNEIKEKIIDAYSNGLHTSGKAKIMPYFFKNHIKVLAEAVQDF